MDSDEMKYSLLHYYRFKRAMHIIATEVAAAYGNNLADVMFCTDTGHISEIEVKVSISDLWADFKNKEWKHDAITKGRVHFNKFYFAIPKNILEEATNIIKNKSNIYGIICVDDLQYCDDSVYGGAISIVNKAKWINKEKWEGQKQKIIWRMSSELCIKSEKVLLNKQRR